MVVVGKYSKCHNSPANGPTVSPLGWLHPIIFPILEHLLRWDRLGRLLSGRVQVHLCCKTVTLMVLVVTANRTVNVQVLWGVEIKIIL